MRFWKRWLASLALFVALIGTAAGVQAEDPPTIAPFTTARVRVEGTVSAQGQVLPIQGEGEIDATKGASRLTIAVLGAAFETIVVDGRTYSRNSRTGRWEYSEGTQAGGFNPARLAPYDLATIRAAGSNFTRVGPETVDGVVTTRWRADADLERLLGLSGSAASGAGLGQTAATMDLWIGDADQRLRRLTLETQGAVGAGTPVPSAAGQSLTLTFSNFDAEVRIIAPAGAVQATPGIPGGIGAIATAPVPTVPVATNIAATRVAAASATIAAVPSRPPGAISSPSSIMIVRLLGVVSLVSIGISALIVLQHRRKRGQTPLQ